MDRKSADPSIQLDVDEQVLDYLVFSAIKGILDEHEDREGLPDFLTIESKAASLLQMVDSFLKAFRVRHKGERGSPQLRFRLQLLRFTAMFTRHSAPVRTSSTTSKLGVLREKRRQQSKAFRSNDENPVRLDLPGSISSLPPSDSVRTGQELLFEEQTPQKVDTPISHEVNGPGISFLDTLPLFMALSASHNTMQGATITKTWMELAAGYMAQAAIEQYSVYGSQHTDVIRESFAWGFDAECDAEEGSDQWHINTMFWDEEGAVAGWDAIRDEHIQALIPPEGVDLHEYLGMLIANDLSIFKFEESILEFLTKLHQCQPRPLLAQVELGEVAGVPRRHLRALHEVIGIAQVEKPI